MASITNCPLRISGEKLAQKLDEKLEEYRNSIRDNSDVGSGSAGPSDLYNSRLVGPASSIEGVNSHSETPGGSDLSAKKARTLLGSIY